MINDNLTDKLEIEGRKRLSMTGVISVDGFSEQVLHVSLEGSKVRIIGENIKITAYNKTTGNLIAEGKFGEIKYNYKKQPIIKRVFK